MALLEKERELVTLSDFELVDRVYELVQKVDDDDLANAFYFTLTEAFERFVPHIERALSEAGAARDYPGDPEGRDGEVEAHLKSMERREAARLILRAFPKGENDA
jgi:hypothetical protein